MAISGELPLGMEGFGLRYRSIWHMAGFAALQFVLSSLGLCSLILRKVLGAGVGMALTAFALLGTFGLIAFFLHDP